MPSQCHLSVLTVSFLISSYTLAAPGAAPNVADAEHPLITAAPTVIRPTRTSRWRRGLVDDIQNNVQSELDQLGSNIPSYVASGVPNFFQDFPTGDKVQSSLGLDDDQVEALPTQVLNVPGYANWTDRGWNLRFHGNVYKQPNIQQPRLDDLANIFLIDTSVEDLPPEGQAQARNLTASIFVIHQEDQNVAFNLAPAPSAGASGDQGGGGAATPQGENQRINFPDPTTEQGDFDGFVPIENQGLEDGDATSRIQRLNVYTEGDINGNATAYLVPEKGLSIISDIDDILRVTKIYIPKEGLLNSFGRPLVKWENMPDIYANWSRSIPDFHFHYLTTTPEQLTRSYMDFIFKTYPGGSFDTRPLNFSDVSATLAIRKFLLEKIFATFPERRFILVADTSNSDVLKDYPSMLREHPQQVQCIFLRNTSATDPGNKFPYDTSGFEGLDTDKYMFFRVPNDLTRLDIANGECVNKTVAQNVTFGMQGLPFGINLGDGDSGAPQLGEWWGAWVMALGAALGLL